MSMSLPAWETLKPCDGCGGKAFIWSKQYRIYTCHRPECTQLWLDTYTLAGGGLPNIEESLKNLIQSQHRREGTEYVPCGCNGRSKTWESVSSAIESSKVTKS